MLRQICFNFPIKVITEKLAIGIFGLRSFDYSGVDFTDFYIKAKYGTMFFIRKINILIPVSILAHSNNEPK